MNIALSAILLIILLLPGTTVVLSYYKSFTEKVSNIYISFNDLIFRGLIFSFLIHCIAVCILSLFGKTIQLIFLYDLLIGKDLQKDMLFSNELFVKYFKQFCFYMLIVIICSWFVTKSIKYYIQKNNFDLNYFSLRTQNYWFHLFSARYLEGQGIQGTQADTDFIFLDILTEKSLIYSGILLDFNYSPTKDELENVVLRNATKRACLEIDYTKHLKKHKLSSAVDIPGDALAIPASQIININIYYVALNNRESLKNPTETEISKELL